MPREILEKDDPKIKMLIKAAGETITHPDGELPFEKDMKERALFMRTGVLLFSRSEASHPKVSEARATVKRSRYRIIAEYGVDLDVLQRIYKVVEFSAEDIDYSKRVNERAINAGEAVVGPPRKFLDYLDRAARGRFNDLMIIRRRELTIIEAIRDDEIVLFDTLTKSWGDQVIGAVASNGNISGGNRRADKHQEGSIVKGQSWQLPHGVEGVRLQFNHLTDDGEALICRIFYSQSDINEDVDVVKLGYLQFQADLIERGYRSPHGIVLMSGPTGSGKSTTVRTILRMIIKDTKGRANILTVENPAEVPIPGAKALKVMGGSSPEEKRQAGVDAMSAALRSAPRVMFIGEVRNEEEVGVLFVAASTGHLCLTTVHANTALGTGTRLQGEGASDAHLRDPMLMRVMIAQRLLPGLCPKCKISVKDSPLDAKTETRLRNVFRCDPGLINRFYVENKDGCAACDFRGRSGRKIAAEVVLPDAQVLDILFRDGEPAAKEYWLNKLGGFTIEEHALVHLINGEVGVQEFEAKIGFLEPIEQDRLDIILSHTKPIPGHPKLVAMQNGVLDV